MSPQNYLHILLAVAAFTGAAVPNTLAAVSQTRATWTADNGNGTFTNPLFYDEFSDPDLIRVGEDYYMTGTTMHTMPGLPILHSRDLVNWKLLGYAFDRLDLGPEFRLEDGKGIYGQGIWAPSFRYRPQDGTFHIFTNVNRHRTQHFTAKNPAGPWTRTAMKTSLHDLSVLFDDDGHAYVVWGYRDLQFARLTDDLSDIVPETRRTLFEESAGMGEGSHFYKINGEYIITSAWYAGRMRMPAARAKHREGPYEVNFEISGDEEFGWAEGNRLRGSPTPPFTIIPGNPESRGHMAMHQGGIVDTPTGEWWGFSMMEGNATGRLTCLSPITWQDGWPYFGLPGNLRRTPRTWVKPDTGHTSPPKAPYQRNDDFSGPKFANVWQWNHAPDENKWSLTERPGFLRLRALPAADFWRARNTLTQRSIGPKSTPTTLLDASGLKPGDVAGLALLNLPYAWIGVRRDTGGLAIEHYNQLTGKTARVPLDSNRVWLRADCDFLKEIATFSYSTDGTLFQPLGGEFPLVFQLKTFQGVRYSLFAFNTAEAEGGVADFDEFHVEEPHPRGLMRSIPFGREITLALHGYDLALGLNLGVLSAGPSSSALRFVVEDRGLGRVALRTADGRFVHVMPPGARGDVTLRSGDAPPGRTTFQWMENVYGDVNLMSLATNRFLKIEPAIVVTSADELGPDPNRRDGVCLEFSIVQP